MLQSHHPTNQKLNFLQKISYFPHTTRTHAYIPVRISNASRRNSIPTFQIYSQIIPCYKNFKKSNRNKKVTTREVFTCTHGSRFTNTSHYRQKNNPRQRIIPICRSFYLPLWRLRRSEPISFLYTLLNSYGMPSYPQYSYYPVKAPLLTKRRPSGNSSIH